MAKTLLYTSGIWFMEVPNLCQLPNLLNNSHGNFANSFFYRAVLNKEPVCWMCPGIISVALHGGVLFFNAPKQSEA